MLTILQVGTVALVGNGPVSQQQRLEIAAMDVIVRFNVPNGFSAAAGERLTVWAVRHAQHAARRGYWGPEQLDDATSEQFIAGAEVEIRAFELTLEWTAPNFLALSAQLAPDLLFRWSTVLAVGQRRSNRDLVSQHAERQQRNQHHNADIDRPTLCGVQQVWLLGGPAHIAERLTAALPSLGTADVVHVPEDDLVACYRTELRDRRGHPSSGWIGAYPARTSRAVRMQGSQTSASSIQLMSAFIAILA